MPVINDAVVVNSAYDTSGNGGRKLISLKKGNKYALVKDGTSRFMIYKLSNVNGSGTLFLTNTISNMVDACLETNGTYIYSLSSTGGIISFRAFDEGSANYFQNTNIDTGQTAIGNVSLAINEAGTELHAAWASKNSAYPNSFNIRYAKGTINTDGSVVWGALEQVTQQNSTSRDFKNPTISVVNGGIPTITAESFTFYLNGTETSTSSNASSIVIFKRDTTLTTGNAIVSTSWSYKNIITDTTYPQSSPSAIFVPQRINGLANGLMAVAWHGTDSTHTTANYIRFSKATDGIGATWSAMKKLVPGTNATLTANKSGKLFITYEDAGVTKRIESTDNGDNWSSAITVGTGTNPSSLFDLTMDMSAPLTIRKGASSVLFTGSWITLTNSVPSGNIGQKTSKDNLLTYAVTTDGTMSTITEKVNGVTVGTKTATSGQSLTVSLTQAQWDAVRYGKYANTTGGRNTLTIETGTEVWTYTFDKIPPVDAQITELLKSHVDSADVAIPAKKALLGASIRGKGGTVNDTDSLEVMAGVIGGIQLGVVGGKRWSSGNFTKNNVESHTITGIPFKPSIIFIWGTDANSNGYRFSMHESSELFGKEGVRFSDIYAVKTGYSTASGSRQFENALKAEINGFTLKNNIVNGSNLQYIVIE